MPLSIARATRVTIPYVPGFANAFTSRSGQDTPGDLRVQRSLEAMPAAVGSWSTAEAEQSRGRHSRVGDGGVFRGHVQTRRIQTRPPTAFWATAIVYRALHAKLKFLWIALLQQNRR